MNGILICLCIVAPDQRTQLLACGIARVRNIVEIHDTGTIRTEHRHADRILHDIRAQAPPKLRARVSAARLRRMKENLHLPIDRLAVMMHHRMQKVAKTVFVVAQLFEKLLLLFDERFSRNHRISPLSSSMILGGKGREMLDFSKSDSEKAATLLLLFLQYIFCCF